MIPNEMQHQQKENFWDAPGDGVTSFFTRRSGNYFVVVAKLHVTVICDTTKIE
jgi:hypothetical protein